MRKKLLKLPIRQTQLLPKPIVTFDNKDHCQSLLEPVGRKLCNKDAFNRHMAILRASAAQAGTACLANNQILQEQRMIALHRRPLIDNSHPNSMQWISLQYQTADDYEVFTDPQVLSGQELVEQHEESISFPFINFRIKRYDSIAVKFKNQQNAKEERLLKGYAAWAFQQSFQQLNGTVLLDWRVNHGNIYFLREAAEYFPKSTAVLQEYVSDLKKIFEQHPQLIATKDKFSDCRQVENQLHNEMLPFQSDYYRRLMKHYQRQMSLLHERLNSKGKERVWKDQSVEVKIINK